MAHAQAPAMTGMSGLYGDDLSLPSPDTVANLTAWWSAGRDLYSDPGGTVPVVADAAEVTLWRSNPGAPASPLDALAVAGKRATLRVGATPNGLPVIRGDAADDVFEIQGAGLSAAGLTILAVVKTDSAAEACWLGAVAGPFAFSIGVKAGGSIAMFVGGVEFAAGASAPVAGFHIAAATYVSAGGAWEIFFDGVSDGSGTAVHVFDPIKALGAGGTDGSRPWTGDIADVMFYSAVLSAPDLAIVTNYLKSHYGIT